MFRAVLKWFVLGLFRLLGAAAAQPAPSNPPVATQLLPEDSRLLIACEKILGVKFFHSRCLTSRRKVKALA